MDSANFDSLPQELIEYILRHLNFQDVCNFLCVSTKFRDVCSCSKMWKKKFQERWPQLMKYYTMQDYDWKTEFQACYICRISLCRRVAQMSSKFYDHDEMSKEAFTEFKQLSDHPLAHYFLVDELEQILHCGNPNDRLTDKYYAQRVLRFLRHEHLQTVWREFLACPPKYQLLETGATLLAQWCQPTDRISTESTLAQLDKIALLIKEEIVQRYPKHPIVQSGLYKSDATLEKSLWLPAECRTALHCLNTVFFHHLKFQGNNNDYYSTKNSYINQVLECRKGIPITLSVIYAAVARRLGVVCLPVLCPGHSVLKWKEYPDCNLPDEQAYTFIDVYDQGKFLSVKDCQDLIPSHMIGSTKWNSVADPIQVFRRMCWNLVEVGRQQEGMGDGLMCLCNALELLAILNPEDVECRLLLARVYLHLNINLEEVMSLLQEISARDPASTGIVAYMCQAAQSHLAAQRVRHQTRKLTVKHRMKNPTVQYAVGMIMTHKKYNYTCVIYGWDPVCAASRDWIYQMGVCNLTQKENQPFYNVLVEDGSNRYAAQENLEIAQQPKTIPHLEVGKYFQFFCNTHYIPNEEKEAEYPEDDTVRQQLIQEAYGASGE